MSAEGWVSAPHWLIRDRSIPSNAKLVYLYLSGRQNDKGVSWPGIQTIADDLGIGTTTVKRMIEWLEKDRLLSVKRSRAGNQYRCHPYRKGRTKTVQQLDQNGPTSRTKTVPKEEPLKKNQEEEPLIGEVVTPFDEFWKVYPRKDAKEPARKAFKKACRKANPAALVQHAARYAAWIERNNKQDFMCLPTTWLNQERWNDQLRDAAEPQSNTQGWLSLARDSAYTGNHEGVPELEGGAPWT